MIIIGGDVVGDCRLVLEQAAPGAEDSPGIAREIEICTKAGFPPRGAPLPDTGGPPLLTVVGTVLLSTGVLGLLAARRRRGP